MAQGLWAATHGLDLCLRQGMCPQSPLVRRADDGLRVERLS